MIYIYLVPTQPSCEHKEKGKRITHLALWCHRAGEPSLLSATSSILVM